MLFGMIVWLAELRKRGLNRHFRFERCNLYLSTASSIESSG
jgi:hypothetical protein